MLSEQQIAAYITMAAITAVIIGALQSREPEGAESVFLLILAAIWPLPWAVCLVAAIVTGPFWIGQKLRLFVLSKIAARKLKP